MEQARIIADNVVNTTFETKETALAAKIEILNAIRRLEKMILERQPLNWLTPQTILCGWLLMILCAIMGGLLYLGFLFVCAGIEKFLTVIDI